MSVRYSSTLRTYGAWQSLPQAAWYSCTLDCRGVLGLPAGHFFIPREEEVVAALKGVLRSNWFKEGRDRASLCLKGLVVGPSRGDYKTISCAWSCSKSSEEEVNVALVRGC